MKTNRLQAAFARKREADHIRTERTQAANRYFDHWGKVTSRFETWTTPEYYEQAEETLRKTKEKQIKEEKLNERREKLKSLLDDEKIQYENELTGLLLRKQSPSVIGGGRGGNYSNGRRYNKIDSVGTNILEKIDKNLKDIGDERKRLELEAKLYKRWRHPSASSLTILSGRKDYPDDNNIFESKSDNEVMAKLNWLDKQIEDQMKREDEAKESEQRVLKLQEEIRRREEALCERQKIRASEIKELRAIQQSHVDELKQRECETATLQQDEIQQQNILKELHTEMEEILSRKNQRKTLTEIIIPHNMKKVKTIFRQCSDEFRDQLRQDLNCLKRIQLLCSTDDGGAGRYDESIAKLIEKFEIQYNFENLNQLEIGNMYESEAKHNLKKWYEIWQQQQISRETKLIDLLERRKSFYGEKLTENLRQQKMLIEVRETHLSAIENSNEKLKMLINENQDAFKDSNNLDVVTADKDNSKDLNGSGKNKMNYRRSNSSVVGCGIDTLERTKSRIFGWLDTDTTSTTADDNEFVESTRRKLASSCSINNENNNTNNNFNALPTFAPKFGKKKIAWT